jgi:hypothetical protein
MGQHIGFGFHFAESQHIGFGCHHYFCDLSGLGSYLSLGVVTSTVVRVNIVVLEVIGEHYYSGVPQIGYGRNSGVHDKCRRYT